ncbi:MAG TPA: IS982 family transposase [Thermoleophilia bacterium]
MDASLETLVIAAYVFACSLSIPRSGPQGKATDQELIALAVAQAVTGLVSDRQFLGTIGRLLPGCFPHLPGQSQFNRRLRRLTPQITRVQLGVAELVACGSVRLVDGTLLGCANYAGCASKSGFAGQAAYGYCAAKSRWYWGMRLLLISDRRGAPLGYDLRPANENEREGVFQLACAHPGSLLFADAGHRGREYHESLQLVGVELIVPDKHRLGERLPAEINKARIRLVIESVFATLKGQMRLEEHLAKTLPGLAQRIVQRLLALTLGMFINTLLGRPPRALAAYDGR